MQIIIIITYIQLFFDLNMSSLYCICPLKSKSNVKIGFMASGLQRERLIIMIHIYSQIKRKAVCIVFVYWQWQKWIQLQLSEWHSEARDKEAIDWSPGGVNLFSSQQFSQQVVNCKEQIAIYARVWFSLGQYNTQPLDLIALLIFRSHCNLCISVLPSNLQHHWST